MDVIAALVITMSVSVYAPDAGGLNGGHRTSDGTEIRTGIAACSRRYPFGTVFEIMVDVSTFGLPQVVECRDRGGFVGDSNLDVLIRTGDSWADLRIARAWGRRRVPVRVWRNWGEYYASQ